MTTQQLEQNVTNTQTGGVENNPPQELPKNIKPVQEQAPVVEQQSTVITQNNPVVQTEAVQPKSPSFNENYVKQLYDYTNKYSQMTAGRDINYDKFVAKYFSSPESATEYYNSLIQRSKILPINVKTGTKDEFINNVFTVPQEKVVQKEQVIEQTPEQIKGVSDFVRTPIAESQDNYIENIRKAAEQKILDTNKKFNIEAAGDIMGSQKLEEPVVKTTPLIGTEEEVKVETPSAIDKITLKEWDPAKYPKEIPSIPKDQMPKEFVNDLTDFSFEGIQKRSAQKTLYNSEVARLSQVTAEDKSNMGTNPWYSLKQEESDPTKPIFDWQKNISPDATATEYWTSVMGNDDSIPLNNIDIYGSKRSELRKVPASVEKIFDDYYKYMATVDPESAKLRKDISEINQTRKSLDGKYPTESKEVGDILSDQFGDMFQFLKTGKTEGKNQLLENAKKGKNVIGGQMLVNDVEGAFNVQRQAIIGEFYKNKANGIDTQEQTTKALQYLETLKDKVYKLNPKLLSEKLEMIKAEDDRIAKQEYADMKEKVYRANSPFLASIYYDWGGMGFQEGGKEVLNDFASTLDFVTGTPTLFTQDLKSMTTPETLPTSLQGDIWDADGFHPGRLMNQATNTVTQMVGLLGGSKGLGTLGKMGKVGSGLESTLIGDVLLTGKSADKLGDFITMYTAAYGQSHDDYYESFKNALTEQGYSDNVAEIIAESSASRAASTMATLENLVGLPFMGKVSKNIKTDFSSLLKEGYNGWDAFRIASKNNLGNIGGEITKQYGEEFLQSVGDNVNNAIFNKAAGVDMLDTEMTFKSAMELLAVTGVSTLFMAGGTGNLYQAPLQKKAAIAMAIDQPEAFNAQLDEMVESGKMTKEQANITRQSVKEVESAIIGLPSAKKLSKKQKIDLGLLIYEKKKLDEQVKGGYVDEIFAEQKNAEIDAKKKKLNDKILQVYNEHQDKKELERIRVEKEKSDAIEAEEFAKERKRVIERVKKQTEDLEAEEDIVYKALNPTPKIEGKASEREAQFDIKDGHHRYIAYQESGVKEVPAVDETGETKNVPIEELNPTQNLEEKDRTTIESLKESISKGEKIEPIKIESNAKEVRSNKKRPNEEGQVGEVSQNNGGQNIQLQEKAGAETGNKKEQVTPKKTIGESNNITLKESSRKALNEYDFLKSKEDIGDKTFSPTKEYSGKIPFKGTGERASAKVSDALPIAESKVRSALKQEGYSEEDINTILDKSRKKEIIVNSVGETKVREEAQKEITKQKDEKKAALEKIRKSISKGKDKQTRDNNIKKYTQNEVNTTRGKKVITTYNPATKDQVATMKAELGMESSTATTPVQLYNASQKQGKTVDEFLDAVDVAMGRKESTRKEMAEKTAKDITTKALAESKTEKPKKKKGEVENKQTTKSNEQEKSLNQNMAAVNTRIDELKTEQESIRKQAEAEKNPAVKKALNTLESALMDDNIKKPTDVKIDGKTFGAWLVDNKANMTESEYNSLKEKYSNLVKSFGKIDELNQRKKAIVKALEYFANLNTLGNGTLQLNIGEVFLYIPKTIIKYAAKSAVRHIKKADARRLDKAGKLIIEDIKKSKWYNRLSQSNKNSLENYFKDFENPFEAVADFIGQGALEQGLSGEQVFKEQKEIVKKEDAKAKKKITLAGNKRKRLKKRSGSENVPVNNKQVMRQFAELDPKEVYEAGGIEALNEYIEIANDLLKSPPVITNEQVKSYLKKQNEKISKEYDRQFLEDHADMIDILKNYVDADGKKVLSENPTVEEIRDAFIKYGWEKEFYEKTSKTKMSDDRRGELVGNILNKTTDIKAMVKEGVFKNHNALDKSVIENVSKLSPEGLTDAQLVRANYILSNIKDNQSTDGAGQVEAMALSQIAQKEVEEIFKKYNKEGLKTYTNIFQEQSLGNVRSIGAALNFMTGTKKMSTELRKALKIQEVASGHSQAIQDVTKKWNDGLKGLTGKYGRDIVSNLDNRLRQGMYATLIQNDGVTENNDAWFQKQKELIEADIKQKENSVNYEAEAKVLKKIYEETFEKATTLEDAHKAMAKHQGDKAVVDLAMKTYADNIDLFEQTSRIYGNTEFKKWNNYTHRRWKTNKSELGLDELTDDIASFGMTSDRVNRKEASSALDRNIVMPDKTKVLNLDFFAVQDKALTDAYYQSKTLGSRHAMREIMENEKVRELMGKKNHEILKKRIVEMVNNQMGLSSTEYQVKTALASIGEQTLNFLLRNRVMTTLGGPLAFVKQSVPAMLSSVFRTGDLNIMTGFNGKVRTVDDNLFSYSNIRNRKSATKIGGLERGNVKTKAASRKIAKAWNKIDYLTGQVAENIVMAPLTSGDMLAAKTSWMAYYKQYMKEQGVEKIDWDAEAKNPNKMASTYADQMIETSQNVNDISMAGNFFKDQDWKSKAKRFVLAPYSSFAVNQDARMMDAVRGILAPGYRTEAAQEIGAIVTEQVAFQLARTLASTTIAALVAYAWAPIMGASDKEQDEIFNKRMSSILPEKLYWTKLMAETIFDIMPTAMVTTPGLMNFTETFVKRSLNDKLSDWLGLTDAKGKSKNLLTVRYTPEYEDPNFKGTLSEEAASYFGMVGDLINDIEDSVYESLVGWDGEYELRNGRKVKLNDYQKRTLALSASLKFMALFGLGTQETGTAIRVNKDFVKKQLKGIKSSRGNSSDYGAGYGGGNYGTGGY